MSKFFDKYYGPEKESIQMSFVERLLDRVPKPDGIFRAKVFEYGKSGKKRLVHLYEDNIVVNGGRTILAHLLPDGDVDYRLVDFALGDGHHTGGPGQGGGVGEDILDPVAFTAVETALEQELFRKAIASFNFPDSVTVTFVTVVLQAEANGGGTQVFTEAGQFSTNNTMFNAKAFPALVKNADREFQFEWSIVF